MKINRTYIKAPVLAALVIFLYGFSQSRNAKRKLGKISIEYTNGQHYFITPSAVNKLLIVNEKQTKNQSKDSLNLNTWEQKLNHNPMIAKAEVFETITGNVGALITQRQPYARVVGENSYYIDAQGNKMPLSPNYSARVPMVTGIDTTAIADLFPLLKKIHGDQFLTRNIVGIKKSSDGDYILALRDSPMTINFGKISNIDQKTRNFKAFYKNAYLAKKLDDYSKVNLKFRNQVVCTKKEA